MTGPGGTAIPPGALRRLPGVPESRLDSETTAQLPQATPPPPWEAAVDAVLWVQHAARGVDATLPPGLRPRRGLRVGIGGFVRYRDTPVGSYDELLACPTLVRGGLWRLHVPLIAVDSPASLHAGRAHWALPKVLAGFAGRPEHGQLLEARGQRWWVRARIAASGPAVPARLRVSLAQVWPDGVVRAFPVTFRGRVRIARVRVAVSEDASFSGWLKSGTHLGVLLSDTHMRLPAPS